MNDCKGGIAMPAVQLQQNGQLALPVDFCKALGLKPGDIFNAELVDNKIILTPKVSIKASETKRIEAKKRFFEIVDRVRKRTEDIPLDEIQAAVDEAVAFAKEQELKEILRKDKNV
jgi:bifunctional DNA-binding transcriptional regulator/antitoxin component of YhaV-PrlF toxin-antitoxin module